MPRALTEILGALLVAAILALFARSFVLQAYRVPSGSMSPTLRAGDQIVVNKFVYRAPRYVPWMPARAVRRGDVVVHRQPGAFRRLLVKRCLAVGGDRVSLRDKELWINGIPRLEGYAAFTDDRVYPNSRYLEREVRSRDNFGPHTVAPGSVWCLGDRRDESADSRRWGDVPRTHLVGRATAVYWSRSAAESEAPGDRPWASAGWVR